MTLVLNINTWNNYNFIDVIDRSILIFTDPWAPHLFASRYSNSISAKSSITLCGVERSFPIFFGVDAAPGIFRALFLFLNTQRDDGASEKFADYLGRSKADFIVSKFLLVIRL